VDTKASSLTILGTLGIVTYMYVRHTRVAQKAVKSKVFLLCPHQT